MKIEGFDLDIDLRSRSWPKDEDNLCAKSEHLIFLFIYVTDRNEIWMGGQMDGQTIIKSIWREKLYVPNKKIYKSDGLWRNFWD